MLRWNPNIHEMREVPLNAWLKREFPDRVLFVFFNHQSNGWEIGEWRGGGKVIERALIGPSLDDFDRHSVVELRTNLDERMRREVTTAMIQRMQADERAQYRADMDERDARRDLARWVRKKPGHDSPFWAAMSGRA